MARIKLSSRLPQRPDGPKRKRLLVKGFSSPYASKPACQLKDDMPRSYGDGLHSNWHSSVLAGLVRNAAPRSIPINSSASRCLHPGHPVSNGSSGGTHLWLVKATWPCSALVNLVSNDGGECRFERRVSPSQTLRHLGTVILSPIPAGLSYCRIPVNGIRRCGRL